MLIAVTSIPLKAGQVSAEPSRPEPTDAKTPPLDAGRLFTRMVKVEPGIFNSDQPQETKGDAQEPNDLQFRVREFLMKAGVNFQKADPPAVFFNDRTGVLLCRANEADLERIEQVLGQNGKTDGPKVRIEVRIAEVSEAAAQVLAEAIPRFRDTHALRPVDLAAESTNRIASPPYRSWVLTSSESAILIRAIEMQEGIDIISAPPVVTVTGKSTRVEIEGGEEPVFDPPFHAPSRKRR